LGEFRDNSKSSQGDAYFVAPNPPFGAVISYYLPEGILSSKETRREAEKAIEKDGGDTPYPGFDAMRAEEIEEAPAMVLTISDSDGNPIRHLEAPAGSGFHRIAWDLRLADSSPWKPTAAEPEYMVTKGPLVAPGDYSVSLQRRVNGQLQETGLSTPITVNMMRQNKLATASAAEVSAFGLRLDDMMRRGQAAESALKETLTQLGAIKDTVMRSNADLALREMARSLELDVLRLQVRLSGNEARDLLNDQGPVSVSSRAMIALMGTSWSTYGPTPTHLRSLEIAEQGLAGIKQDLDRVLKVDLPALHEALDKAGVPWTPGRGIP